MQPTLAQRIALWLATLTAWGAVVGSLILSNLLYFPPCDLCWWQRIFFYPLAVIFPVAMLRKDIRGAAVYGLPLAIGGWLVALYQTLLQWDFINESSIIPCSLNNPCSEKQIDIFGFITIPFLSLVGFTVVLLCLFVLLGKRRVVAPAPVKKRVVRRTPPKKKTR